MANKQYKVDALDLLRKELLASRGAIDELNGRLSEVCDYLDFDGDVEEVRELIEQVAEFYRILPTWDSIEHLVSKVEEAKKLLS
jgi:hypothetical protein